MAFIFKTLILTACNKTTKNKPEYSYYLELPKM